MTTFPHCDRVERQRRMMKDSAVVLILESFYLLLFQMIRWKLIYTIDFRINSFNLHVYLEGTNKNGDVWSGFSDATIAGTLLPLYIINKMKLGIRPHVKFTKKDEDIQPWNAQESTMLHLIIQSGDMQMKPLKNPTNHLSQQQAYSPNVPNKQKYSYNFNNNLRKYEKMKADNFQSKKQVNFIEKNIKGVSQDFMFLEENSPNLLMNKLVQEKQRKDRTIEQDLTKSIEPVNWSLIMWYEEDKSLRKYRHKDIQSFLRTQSRSAGKRSIRRESQERSDNAENFNKSQAEKFQRLLKLREGLRKRNLKSASQSRKVIKGSLTSEDNYRTIMADKERNNLRLSDNTATRSIPKTSQSTRNNVKAIKLQRKNISPQQSMEKRNARFLYTSHKNRLQPKKISLEYRSRAK